MNKQTVWIQRDLDAAPLAMALLDQSGRVRQINAPCSRLLGRPAGQLIGTEWFSLLDDVPEHGEKKHIFQRVMSGEHGLHEAFDSPLEAVGKNGSRIAWRMSLLRDELGSPDGALCYGSDMNEHYRAEQALRISSEEQGALNAILRLSLENIPLKTQFERVLDILLGLDWLPFEPKGGIFLVQPGEDVLSLAAQRRLPRDLLRQCARVPFGHCLCGRAAATRETQFSSCLDRRHVNRCAGTTPHGHYVVPIISNRVVLGVIVLYLRPDHQQQDREYEFLQNVAGTLAGMINLHHAQEELRQSRARLKKTQHLAQLGGWEWDSMLHRFTLSEESCRILQLPPEDSSVGLSSALNFFHPDDRAAFCAAITQAATEGDAVDVDYRIRLRDGTERVVNCQAEPTFDAAGNVRRLNGMLHDITERKQVEENLRLSAAVFENTTEGVMITDKSAAIIIINKAFSSITGYTLEELRGKTAAVLKSGRQDAQFYADMWKAIHETGSWQGEIWNRRKSGEIYPEWLNISAVKDKQGEITNYVAVFSDITEMKESESRLKHLAHHDPLTGLPNRLLLNACVHQSISAAQRNGSTMAVMFLDLDKFKLINDTLGHPVGDQLLLEVSRRLLDTLRAEDLVSRLGGDEFVVVLEDLPDSRFAGNVAKKINAALAEKFHLDGHELFISCSIGISIFPGDGDNIDELFKNADTALYRAKEEGRNNYQYYTEELTKRAMERMSLETDLRQALERNELELYYQPQLDLYNGRICGMEALLRWQHPRNGLMLPSSFIPLAEESGLIGVIGHWVLRTACARLKAWHDAGLPRVRVSINLSAAQFRHKNLAQLVAAALQDSGLAPEYLELELTESIVMQDAEATIEVLRTIKKLGVKIAIDDFGTGYSSLSYLKRFPVDRIKIDQSFVRNITSDPADAAVSQAIISMSHSLNLVTLAEGVETEAQREFLRSRHCNEMQGHHFSPAITAQAMEEMMRSGRCLDAPSASHAHHERTLLLLDDDEYLLAALASTLHTEGYRILCATCPGEALDFLAKHPVGVIISEHHLPEMTGIELFSKLRHLHPAVVRIMLTGNNDTALTSAAINEGAVFKFVVKPWDNEELRAQVRDAFRHYEHLHLLKPQQAAA